jgi:hypothetical protein
LALKWVFDTGYPLWQVCGGIEFQIDLGIHEEMRRGAVIDVSKDTHGTWEASYMMIQKTAQYCHWLHLEPSCHVNVGLVHRHDTRLKQINTRLLYQGFARLSVTATGVYVTDIR